MGKWRAFLKHFNDCHVKWQVVSLMVWHSGSIKRGGLSSPNLSGNGWAKPDTELEAIEQPEGLLLKRLEQRPSLVKADGLWVHQGTAVPGANWERILEDVREERIESVLKA
jgi:hypothetical protein